MTTPTRNPGVPDSSPAMPVEEIATSIFDEFIRKMEANPEVMIGAFPVGSALKRMMTIVAAKFAEGPQATIDDITDRAFEKADIIFDFHQDVIRSIGSQTDAFANLDRIQRGVYDTAMLYEGTLEGTERKYISFFESEKQMLEEFNGIINNNLLLTHFAGNASQAQVAELPILARALGFKNDMMQTFMRRQFAMTGEANDDLLQSTLAHALAAEKATGISSKIIAEHVGEMIEEVSLFGDMTEEQMTRAAVEVAQLGLEMSTVTNMVRGFNDFESAAGNVAKLTQALGLQVDVMDAVALANESPDQLMSMFRQQFDVAGIDVHSLSMPMKRALADIFGARDTQEVEQMFGNASHGLNEFLAQADEGLASVGDTEVDQALAMAASNLERRRILRGDAAQMGEEAAARIDAALSTALATTMNAQKDRMDSATMDLLQTQGTMIKDGLMQPLVDSIADSSEFLFVELDGLMDKVNVKFEQFGRDIADDAVTLEQAIQRFLGTTPETESQRTAREAREAAAETQGSDFDAWVLRQRAMPRADQTPHNYEFLNEESLNELKEYLGPRIADDTAQAALFDNLTMLLNDGIRTNNMLKIEIDGDHLVFTPHTGDERRIQVTTSPVPG